MRHLDEGEIHAWLDGAVDAAEAGRIEAHVAACTECAAEVATARGLIAGASRILLALDDVPAGVIPAQGSVGSTERFSGAPAPEPASIDIPSISATRATRQGHTPWFARPVVRIAAGLVLVAGVGAVATRDWNSRPERLTVEFSTEPSIGGAMADSAASGPSVAAPLSAAGASSAAADARGRTDIPDALPPATRTMPAPAPGALARSSDASPSAGARVAERDASARIVASAPVSTDQQARAEQAPAVSAGFGAAAAVRRSDDVGALAGSAERRLTGVDVATRDLVPVRPAAPGSSLALTLGGACFELEVAPGSGTLSLAQASRRMRIQLAQSPSLAQDFAAPQSKAASAANQVSAAEGRAASAAPPPPPTARAYTPTLPEPGEALAWDDISRDSLVVRWPTGAELTTFRLQVIGDLVRGTAAPQALSGPPATVTGRRVGCGSGS